MQNPHEFLARVSEPIPAQPDESVAGYEGVVHTLAARGIHTTAHEVTSVSLNEPEAVESMWGAAGLTILAAYREAVEVEVEGLLT
jgi:hypothetical protein